MQHLTPLRVACVVASIAAVPTVAAADAAPTPKDGRWRGFVGAAFSATSGNTEATSLLLNVDAARATDIDKISLGGNYNHAQGTDDAGVRTTTADKASAFGQYDHDFAPAWFGFGRAAFDNDQLIDLSLRSTLAAGVGYRVFDTESDSFTLQAGLGYTAERYSSLQTIDGRMDTDFSTTHLLLAEESAHKVSDTVSFKQRLEVDPSVDGTRRVLVKFNANLAVALNSSLSLNVGVIDTYNTRPPDGDERNDVSLFTGVNYRFGGP